VSLSLCPVTCEVTFGYLVKGLPVASAGKILFSLCESLVLCGSYSETLSVFSSSF